MACSAESDEGFCGAKEMDGAWDSALFHCKQTIPAAVPCHAAVLIQPLGEGH
jgi:hypothetical protein